MFERAHHRRIAGILEVLDADLLAEHSCWFGGGTAIVLAHEEFRESVDLDFLVSDLAGYRELRRIVRTEGLAGIAGSDLATQRAPTADNYGIRAMVLVEGVPIKLEILHEGRLALDPPGAGDVICGVRTLSQVDQVASKLLANDDRWADRSVFSRDLVDLAMMRLERSVLEKGLEKSVDAYGASVQESLASAAAQLRVDPHRLADCLRALKVEAPSAVVWQEIRRVADLVMGWSSDRSESGRIDDGRPG